MRYNSEYSLRTEDICESDCPFSRDFFIKTCSIRGMNVDQTSDYSTTTQSSYGSQMRRLLPHLPPQYHHIVPQRPKKSRFNPRSESTGSIVIPKTVSSIFTPSVQSHPPVKPSSVDLDLPVTPKRFIKINDRPSTPQEFRDFLQIYIRQIPSPSPERPGQAPNRIWYSEERCWMYKRGRSALYSKQPGLGTPKWKGSEFYVPRHPLRSPTPSPPPSPPPKTIVDDIKPVVDTPWDPLPDGVLPAFTIHDPDLLVDDSFSSSTFTREGAPSPSPPPSPPSPPSPSPPPSPPSSGESLYPDSHDTTSSSSPFDEAFLADDETTSLIVPFACSPPPPNNTPEGTPPPPEQQPELSIFQRGWRWIKSWFTS